MGKERNRVFVAVDWGTTHLRLCLAHGESGEILAEAKSADGIGVLHSGEHQAVFLSALRQLLGQPRVRQWRATLADGAELEACFSGMVTADIGWRPTHYLTTPACLADFGIAAQRVPLELEASEDWAPLRRLELRFFPGLRTAVDIARGEELEALGIVHELPDCPGQCLIVLPGTHSKWILVKARKLVDFVTVPTGDLHAALHHATLLARSLPDAPVAIEGKLVDRFDEGVRLAATLGGLSALFRVRSRRVLEEDRLSPEECSALLSGILIGGEVRERLGSAKGLPVLVAGAPALQRLYLWTFAVLSAKAQAVPQALASRAALAAFKLLR